MDAPMWPARDELMERLLAIEAVFHAHPGSRVVEHLLVGLVDFLRSGAVAQAEATEALLGFIAAEPPRSGAVEALEYCVRVLAWPGLIARLQSLATSDGADFRNRDLARHALRAAEPQWRPGDVYRSLRTET